MIIDTRDGLSAKDLLRAIRFENHSGGSFVVQRDANNKLAKMKVHSDQAEWLIDYLQQSQFLSISASTYRGSNVLPNFFATKTVSVAINLQRRRDITKPRQLFEGVCSKLADSLIPLPSAVIVTPTIAFPIWVVNQPYLFPDLGELFTTEYVLSEALREFGSISAPRCASRFIPLPTASSSEGGLPVVMLANGAVKSITRDRLARTVRNSSIPMNVADFFTRQSEVIEELGSLLYARSLDIAGRTDCYWAWMSGFGAAVSTFTEELEVKNTVRNVAMSLVGADSWGGIKTERLESQPYQYQSHLEMIVESTKSGMIKLGSYVSLANDAWPSTLAQILEVSQEEIEALRLHHLVPSSLCASNSHDWSPRDRAVVGCEDYLSIHEFLKAA